MDFEKVSYVVDGNGLGGQDDLHVLGDAVELVVELVLHGVDTDLQYRHRVLPDVADQLLDLLGFEAQRDQQFLQEGNPPV